MSNKGDQPLLIKGGLIAVHNDSIYMVDTDENENYVIIKYRIYGSAGE